MRIILILRAAFSYKVLLGTGRKGGQVLPDKDAFAIQTTMKMPRSYPFFPSFHLVAEAQAILIFSIMSCSHFLALSSNMYHSKSNMLLVILKPV